MDGRSSLTLGIAAVAAVLLVVGALLGQRKLGSRVVFPALALIASLYLPETPGNWMAITALGVFAGISGSLVVIACVVLAAVGVAHWVPGGWNAAVLVLIAVACVAVFRDALRHLIRLRRAWALEPGEAPVHLVGLSGTVVGKVIAPPPGAKVQAAWWLLEYAPRRATSAPLRLASPAGTVLVEPEAITVKLRRSELVTAPREEVEALLPPRPPESNTGDAVEKDPEVTYSLYWLEPDEEVTVVGKPEWGRAPADMAGYRDAPLVPLFRGADTSVVDGSAHEVARHAIFDLVAWSMWSVAVAAAAAGRLGGWV